MRTGRPKVENPKKDMLKVRIDKQMNEELMRYCEEHGVTRTQVVRKGVELVLRSKQDQ